MDRGRRDVPVIVPAMASVPVDLAGVAMARLAPRARTATSSVPRPALPVARTRDRVSTADPAKVRAGPLKVRRNRPDSMAGRAGVTPEVGPGAGTVLLERATGRMRAVTAEAV